MGKSTKEHCACLGTDDRGRRAVRWLQDEAEQGMKL